MRFVDLDKEIENEEGKSITEIFSQQGEDYFRQVESKLLSEFAASSESFIMATGGGAPCFYNGINTINESGVSIFLDASIERLVAQTSNRSTRPLLQNNSDTELRDKLITIRKTRLPVYQQARITIDQPDVDSVMKALHL